MLYEEDKLVHERCAGTAVATDTAGKSKSEIKRRYPFSGTSLDEMGY